MGRPNKYETHVKSKFEDIKKWLQLGATEREIAKNLGIAESTFMDYKNKYSEFSEFLKENRKKPVEEIKAAMLKRALGFQYTEKKTVKQRAEFPDWVKDKLEALDIDVDKLERPILIRTEEMLKTALPSETAGLILLKHWDKDKNGKAKWTGDPASLEIKKEELEIKKQQAENENW